MSMFNVCLLRCEAMRVFGSICESLEFRSFVGRANKTVQFQLVPVVRFFDVTNLWLILYCTKVPR